MGPAAPNADALMFTRITEWLIRRRAEHNEGMVSTLEELALHQQNIGKIELLGQLCPKLKILYLQNNLIGKLENLHKLKELEYLNMAVNNVTRIQNLQRCESLQKLDLTINFVDKPGLLTISSLQGLVHLKELTLMGNPCTEWSGYRPYVIAKLPQLKRLDGTDIKHSERIAALQRLPELEAQLRADVIKQGLDPDEVAKVEDDSLFDEHGEVKETGTVDEETGEVRRPWCPATRLLDHMENEKANREAEEKKRAGAAKKDGPDVGDLKPRRLEDFPEIKDGEKIMQRNDGRWDFSIEESEDGSAIVLEVDVGKFLDTSLIKADVQPSYIRLLIKGRLLQLLLPCEVKPDNATAVRSQVSGRLVVTLPKEDAKAPVNIALIRPKQQPSSSQGSGLMTATSTTRKAPPAGMAGSEVSTSHGHVGDGVAALSISGGKAADQDVVLSRKQAAVVQKVLQGPVSGSGGGTGAGKAGGSGQDFLIKPVRKAAVMAVEADDDDDAVPDL